MLFDIFVFLIVLSVLVAVHEWGHFIAAKACNIYVDRFSVGMPPRLFGVRWGETDYCVGALPIGGYVKMAGQEDAPSDDETREREYGHVPPERWYNNKPVWQRIIVLVGGPFMNIVLAFVLYAVLAAGGQMVPEQAVSARVGAVQPETPAAEAPLYNYEPDKPRSAYTGEPDTVGWQTGDVILAVDGEPVESIRDLIVKAVLGGTETTRYVRIERTTLDGETEVYLSPIQPKLLDEDERMPRFGFGAFITAQVGRVLEDTPAEAAGLEPGDVIVAADGQIVDWATFMDKVEDLPEGEQLELLIERDGERIARTLTPKTIGRLRALNLEPASGNDPESGLAKVQATETENEEDFPLRRRDVIASVNGEPMSAAALREFAMENPGATVTLDVRRPMVLFGLIQSGDTFETELTVDSVRAIGVQLEPRMVERNVTWAQVGPEAVRESVRAVGLVFSTLGALFAGNVSPRELGGPVMIGTEVVKAADMGLLPLLQLTAFISINLAVINLLPLPVLDGGQIVLSVVEGIRRKPLPPKFLERFQLAGLLLIVSLMLFVTWNDLGRLVEQLQP